MQRVNVHSMYDLRPFQLNLVTNNQDELIIRVYKFVWNQPCNPDDIVVVIDYPQQFNGFLLPGQTEHISIENIDKNRTILWHSEPESIYEYPKHYNERFGFVLSSNTPNSDNFILNGYSFCLFGHGSAYITPDKSPNKSKQCSVITSNKSSNEFHRNRIKFIGYLKKQPIDIDYFGRGVQEIENLNMGLDSYKYHIALANNNQTNLFDEKIVAPCLSECFIFYSGCENIYDFFNEKSVVKIDAAKPEESLAIIKYHIDNNSYEKNIDAIRDNKNRALNNYVNPYKYLAGVIDGLNIPPNGESSNYEIRLNARDKGYKKLDVFEYIALIKHILTTPPYLWGRVWRRLKN